MRKLYAAFASNVVFANIAIFLMFLLGAVAVSNMKREMFPEFSLERVIVTVAYPGADPEEVEEGILRKIEDALQGEEGIKEILTTAEENVGTAMITAMEKADVQELLDRVRAKIDAINTFPADAENPVVTELILKDPVAILSISGDMPEPRMKEWAESTREALLQLPEITVVDIFGAREYEISIEVSEARLREHGLSLQDVSDAVRRNNLNVPGGILRGDNQEIRLRTLGRKYTAPELAELVVASRPGGEIVRLRDIADIVDGFEEDVMRPGVDGAPAVFLYVQKTTEQDALDISEAVHRFVKKQKAILPAGLSLDLILDTTDMLRARIDLLVRNGIAGLLLVFVLLWLFLDLRLSFWVGMGMPISIAGALVILWAIGGSINMISLFGLIMVLGIIVDDAIVVGEAIYHQQQQAGAKALKSAVDGVTEVGVPVFGAVSTTIIAFMPLMYVGGIMGKFISILPVVVIACLVVSLFESLFLLPAHLGVHLPTKGTGFKRLHRFFDKLHDLTGRNLERFAAGPYARFLHLALTWRYVTLSIAVAVLIVTVGAVAGGRIRFRMFPKFDSFILTATVEFPSGTPIGITDAALDHIEEAARTLNRDVPTASGDPVLRHILRLAGQSLAQNVTGRGHQIGSVQLVLVDSTDRTLESDAIQKLWEKAIGVIPGAEALSVEGINAGPPGKPVDVRLRGADLEEMQAAARDLMERLGGFAGTTQIQSDFRPGKQEFRFRLKPEAYPLGLTVEDLGRQLNTAFYGGEALRIQRGRDDLRVMVRYPAAQRRQASDLGRVRIRTADGRDIPLLSVADVDTGPGFSTIRRVDGLRAIGVSCDVDKAVANAGEISATLAAEHFPELERRYPGVSYEFQGEQKDSAESVGSLKVGFPIALVGIYIIIATIFRSYIQPMIIMLTVPFGIIGAVIGHLAMGLELSLMSLFGIVALAGVVVNDAIVLIEAYNHNLAAGMDVEEAMREAGHRRFRAVFLTTITTVGGLAPLILETDLQAQFLIPMAMSIAAGVAFATLLTLVLIPNLMMILNDLRCLVHFLRHGERPERRCLVEPARLRNTLET